MAKTSFDWPRQLIVFSWFIWETPSKRKLNFYFWHNHMVDYILSLQQEHEEDSLDTWYRRIPQTILIYSGFSRKWNVLFTVFVFIFSKNYYKKVIIIIIMGSIVQVTRFDTWPEPMPPLICCGLNVQSVLWNNIEYWQVIRTPHIFFSVKTSLNAANFIGWFRTTH